MSFRVKPSVPPHGNARGRKGEAASGFAAGPRPSSAHNAIANLLKRQGDAEGAKVEYARLQEIKQGDVTRDIALGYLRAGVKRTEANDYAGACAEFRKAVEANPQLGEGWFDLAGALLQGGKTEEAVETFPEALALAPRWPEAHYQFALALLKANQRDRATAELRIALQQDPEHAGAKRELDRLGKMNHFMSG